MNYYMKSCWDFQEASSSAKVYTYNTSILLSLSVYIIYVMNVYQLIMIKDNLMKMSGVKRLLYLWNVLVIPISSLTEIITFDKH